MASNAPSTAHQAKLLGNAHFALGRFEEAVECYTKALELSDPALHSNLSSATLGALEKEQEQEATRERSVYLLNRAQAELKLERVGACAARDSDGAEQSVLAPRDGAQTAWGAMVREALDGLEGRQEGRKQARVRWRGAIEDYRRWHVLAVQKKAADQGSLRVMREEVERLERKLRGDSAPSVPTTPTPAPAVLVSAPPSFSTDSTSSSDPLTAVHSTHSALSSLWTRSSTRLITAWADTAIQSVRVQLVKQACAGVVDLSKRDVQRAYPELVPSTLAHASNLLDLISARAIHPPQDMALHLDVARARVALGLEPSSRSSRSSAAPGTKKEEGEGQVKEYMQLVELPTSVARYGDVVPIRSASEEKAARRLLERGEALLPREGTAVLERQRVLYTVALRAARALEALAPAEHDEGVDEEAVERYEGRRKAREYVGRERYSAGKVEETVRSFLGYAEDHLEFLRTDSEYTSQYIDDRLSPWARADPSTQNHVAHGEALQLLLNGYARQAIWTEALSVVCALPSSSSSSSSTPPGTDPCAPLPPGYARKIGLLTKLVEAFVDLAHSELLQSVEHSFAEEGRRMGQQRQDDAFRAFLDTLNALALAPRAAARPSPFASTRPPEIDPLARVFHALAAIDPTRERGRTGEIVACLNELNALFDTKPEEKSKLSRRLVEGLGEYAEAIELHEMLLDSHQPRIDPDWADKSVFLTNVQPLWIKLERVWAKSIPAPLAGDFLRSPTDASLEALWGAYDRQAEKDLKGSPGALFDALLSADAGAVEEGEEADDEDEPPELVDMRSDDDDDDKEDDDEPPALVDQFAAEDADADSEDDLPALEPASTPSAPAPLPRRPRAHPPAPHAREPQPGPSSGTAPSRRGGVGQLDEMELAIRQREWEAERAQEVAGTGAEAGRRRGEKVKTRKGPAGSAGATQQGRGREKEGDSTATSDSEREGKLPEGVLFRVSKRAYDVWEQVLGGENVRRSDVAWSDFRQAMEQIGFHAEKGSGSRWKFHPRGVLRECGTIGIHEPHPDSKMRVFQVHKIEARLQRRYDLHIQRFEIDTTRRDDAARLNL
ncbi:hypothetical protein JCM10207_003344 [Rhodosporidiobolus poonsookiae]